MFEEFDSTDIALLVNNISSMLERQGYILSNELKYSIKKRAEEFVQSEEFKQYKTSMGQMLALQSFSYSVLYEG